MEIVNFFKTEDIIDKIEIIFVNEREKLSRQFPKAEIEHIGGTSIPGSITKGDLDINIRVKSEDFEKAIKILKEIYEVNQPNSWTKGFASFKDDPRNIGIQLTIIGTSDDCFVAQRDYLKKHPEKIIELNALKSRFESKSMDEYKREKADFFKNLNV